MVERRTYDTAPEGKPPRWRRKTAPQTRYRGKLTLGPKEMVLHEAVQRAWFLWRDEEIRGGVNEPDALRAKLAARQAEWDRTPQAQLDGRSPAEVILEERKGGRRISRKRR